MAQYRLMEVNEIEGAWLARTDGTETVCIAYEQELVDLAEAFKYWPVTNADKARRMLRRRIGDLVDFTPVDHLRHLEA